MPDTNIATRPDPAAAPDQHLATRSVAPAPAAPPDAGGATAALPDLSTPSPNAPDRLTNLDVTEGMADPPGAPSRLPPIPGYQVEKYVGRGGMGTVYRATHIATGRTVALKLTSPHGAQDDIVRDRFMREVRTLAAIKHPNIVPMYDAGEWHGFLYCTMEFVAGGTLNEHLDRIRSDTRGAVLLIVKVARAVEQVHAARLIHRDIKPLNILIGPGDEPLVADFGLAKRLDEDSDLTVTGLPVGTRQYMSPEQTLGCRQHYTAACDVWAMGVTLYELLTGRRPFSDDGDTNVYHAIRTTAPPTMTALSAGVPEPLQAVALKCLAKKPEDRYASAAALADDLDRWLRGEPVLAEPAVPPAPVEEPARAEPKRVKKARGIRVAMRASVAALAALAMGLVGPAGLPTAPPQVVLPPRSPDGKTVFLTGKTGAPYGEILNEPGHVATWDTFDTPEVKYHSFYRSGAAGIAALSHEPFAVPYRLEADVAVTFENPPAGIGGIYVARRAWGGLPTKHESLVVVGVRPALPGASNPVVAKVVAPGAVAPQAAAPKFELKGFADLYWWTGNENGSPSTLRQGFKPWSTDGSMNEVRFARVVVDVRADKIEATVDGNRFPPIKSSEVLTELDNKVKRRRPKMEFTFNEAPFGSGIGIFCLNGNCTVRNLTVTKLDR